MNTSKYIGQYIARIDNRIVASGKSQLDAYKQAKQLFPKKMVTLEYIPTKKETLTLL